MSDRRDQADDPIEAELRSWFRSRATPAAPATLRAFADQVGSGARPTAPLRGLAVGWRQPQGGSRLAALAASVAVVVLAGGLLLVAGQRGPAAPTSSPATSLAAAASSQPTGSPPLATVPSPGLGALYPDGLPMQLDGERVYRPSDPIVVSGGAPVLVAGWVVGWIVPACAPHPSPLPTGYCPTSVQLAESPRGATQLIASWPSVAGELGPGLVMRIKPADLGCSDTSSSSCVAPRVAGIEVLWSGEPATTSPSSPPPPPSSSLPGAGGTCSADQLVVGSATGGFTFGALFYRHATFTQVVRNDGGDCVLGVPKVIGVATVGGPLVAVSANNTGNEVCGNSACHFVTPKTYAIRTGQSFEIEFSVSWRVGANDANGTPLFSAPPCVGGVTDVSRVAFPVASGAIAIDLEAASQEAGASVPWHQVCSSPTSISFEIKP